MDPRDVTREILWNVPDWARALMYILFVAALALLLHGVWSRVRHWRRGRPEPSGEALAQRLRRLWTLALGQAIIWRSPAAGASHLGIFWGFIVLFIGTCIVAIEDYGAWILGVEHLFFHGWFYLAVSCALEIFGILFIGGLCLAILRRRLDRRFRPLARPVDTLVIWLFLVLAVTGFATEGLRIAGADGGMEAHEFEKWSFVGWALAACFQVLGDGVLRSCHLGLWLLHMVLSMAFIALIPRTKLRHIFFSPLHVAASEPRRAGTYAGVSMEEVEETGRYGAGKVADFSWRQLLGFDACTECGRCQSVCPAHATGKPLSPMKVVLDLASMHNGDQELLGDAITEDVLWACTSCGACVAECPVSIDQLGTIVDMRRHLVGEGQIRGSGQTALRSIAASGNPWGLPQGERIDWARGLDVPTIDEEPRPEILFWVGCAGSYDRRSQKVSQALVRILRAANVRFAVLGDRERCTGDPARRMGDEFTFLELAAANVEALNAAGAERIVTACAHCFNTLENEYPALGGNYRVSHHSQLIDELLRTGRLALPAAVEKRIAYHDACYLGRQNGEYRAPRAILEAAGARLREPEQSRQRAFCCGAGGGRMWMEETIGKRVNAERWTQLAGLQPEVVAVACPFCMTMMTDAAGAENSSIAVQDIAEVVARGLA